jgi:hypothetical protein
MKAGGSENMPHRKRLEQGMPKHSTAAAAAPAREKGTEQAESAGTSSNEETQYQGAEKRRSPRYKCEGKVGLIEEGCEVETEATFTDVSLHGCYVEAQATYPVGTVLQMKMEANEMRTEAKGQVRVSYPYRGMGIAFVEMTEANRGKLKELLRTISRPSVIVGPRATSASSEHRVSIGPIITDASHALQAVIDFFENRHMMNREEFLRIIRQSQKADGQS